MLDSTVRPLIEPSLSKMAEKIDAYKIPANFITLGGFGIGLIGCFFLGIQSYLFGLLFILANRLFDGLDGAVARRQGESDFGAYLDIICDIILYAAFIFFFVMALRTHQLAGLFVLFSYLGMTVSYMAYGAISLKNGLEANTSGFVENTEMILFMAAACLFPDAFSAIAFLFGLLCWATTIQYGMKAMQAFGGHPAAPSEDNIPLSE